MGIKKQLKLEPGIKKNSIIPYPTEHGHKLEPGIKKNSIIPYPTEHGYKYSYNPLTFSS